MYTLQDIAALLGGELICADTLDAKTYRIGRVVSPDALRPHTIAVIFHARAVWPKDYQGCLVVDAVHDVPQHGAAIVVPQPRLSFAKLLELLHPVSSPQSGIDQTAVIAADATIDPSATIGPNVVIGARATIGPHCVVSAGCFVGDGVTIGAETRLQPHVVIDAAATVGTHCLIHAGVVIGADGFGFTQCANTHAWQKIPHIGSVCIGNHVEIGANTTIDRGTLSDTTIGDGVKIDNQCVIGHNVVLGDHALMCGASAIGGSTTIGQQVVLAGGTRVVDHVEIVDRVVIKSCSTVLQSITKTGVFCNAFQVLPDRAWARCRHLVQKLPKLYQKHR